MNHQLVRRPARAAALIATLLPALAGAETPTDDWQVRASLYGYLPDISGTTRFAAGGSDIDIAAEDLIENLEVAAMGSFEVQKGRWGGFADLIYINVGDTRSNNDVPKALPLPPGPSARVRFDVDATAFTLAGSYRVLAAPASTVDLFAGARLFDANAELDLSFSAGPLADRGLNAETGRDFLDAVIGVKGARSFGTRGQWFIPFYLDAGAGDADLTWQASLGIGYAAGWGDVFVTYRHLDYAFDSDARIEDLQFDGPTLGFAIHW